MHNKKTILAFLAGASLLAGPSIALAEGEGWFIGARAGSGSVDENALDDSDTTLGVGGGYRWGWLGVELGYADFGAYRQDFRGFLEDGTPITPTTLAELQGWTLGMNARAKLSDHWALTGRAGVFAWDTNAFTDVPTFDRVDFDEDGTDWYAGVGVSYSFNDRFDLGIAYDHYRADGEVLDLSPDVFSVTTEFRF
ncbi:MAG TPA: outer membrane beta-barrel protein [Xanthomonadales bacterium]|nr:outer membrane beta-barrel protein [Xanthomonadales bacterium]